MSKVRTRFAPSPTGYLHVGGARTALFNWLYAKHCGGEFILRIEDTDVARSTEASVTAILDGMKWLGLGWDEGPEVSGPSGPYFQSQRLDIYQDYTRELVGRGKAYPCFCTQEELAAQREEAQKNNISFKYSGKCRNLDRAEAKRRIEEGNPHVIRLRVPENESVVVEDLVHGDVTFNASELDDFILIRSDGMPTYNFTCVVDDALMEITHVLRGDDHLSNTPKQILIYRAFGTLPMPKFGHIPMILGSDRTRLSKRHGATSVMSYREDGYLPQAMVNYLARLGWAHGDQEIFTMQELVDLFTVEKISKTAAVFDVNKLQWLNAHYIKSVAPEELLDEVRYQWEMLGAIPDSAKVEKSWLAAVIKAHQERARTLKELAEHSRFYFKAPESYDPKGVEKNFKPTTAAMFKTLVERLSKLEPFNHGSIEPVYRTLAEELGLKAGEVIQPCRLAFTGATVSPGLFEVAELLGKEETINRLNAAAEWIEKNLGAPSP